MIRTNDKTERIEESARSFLYLSGSLLSCLFCRFPLDYPLQGQQQDLAGPRLAAESGVLQLNFSLNGRCPKELNVFSCQYDNSVNMPRIARVS